MFEELGISNAFAEIYYDQQARVMASGREIDAAFIARGFATVGYEIDFWERHFGPDSYALFVDKWRDNSKFSAQRDHDSKVFNDLYERRQQSGPLEAREWDEIRADPTISAHTKLEIAKRFFPAVSANIDTEEGPLMDAAVSDEFSRLCTLYPLPGHLLFDRETIALRKQVYNAVADEAYGKMGFVKLKRKGGVDILHKPLSDNVSIIIELDLRSIEKLRYEDSYVERFPDGTFRLKRLAPFYLDGGTWLALLENKRHRRLMTFVPAFHCRAAYAGARFYDTSSLEVSVRARALWYELTVEPSVEAMRRVLAEGGQAHPD